MVFKIIYGLIKDGHEHLIFDFCPNFQYLNFKGGLNMEKNILMNEIKLIEFKLNLLKVKIVDEDAKVKTCAAADLYGLLKNSDDITSEDIDAIKVRTK